MDASTDAIFIAGNGFRAADTIAELEHRTGQLVLEANQVLLWSILTTTRTNLQITNYGTLLASLPSDRRGLHDNFTDGHGVPSRRSAGLGVWET
jgi:maleate isomerase